MYGAVIAARSSNVCSPPDANAILSSADAVVRWARCGSASASCVMSVRSVRLVPPVRCVPIVRAVICVPASVPASVERSSSPSVPASPPPPCPLEKDAVPGGPLRAVSCVPRSLPSRTEPWS